MIPPTTSASSGRQWDDVEEISCCDTPDSLLFGNSIKEPHLERNQFGLYRFTIPISFKHKPTYTSIEGYTPSRVAQSCRFFQISRE
ncbi:hypothetical protein CI238_07964 [Colletotrichum incanum]|uniref:Uncharacterized protein n=1 Tax=Colletotrichum incanum TaxID=1573173 RepID=A0A162PHR7_COLIC|nr:hypothetical protein CI238_07964 [Colletotrichum incanum]